MNAFGLLLKEASGPTLLFVNGFGIRAQQLLDPLGKLLPLKTSIKNEGNGMYIAMHQEMKMVGHKTPGEQIAVLQKAFLNAFKEVMVIALPGKDHLPVIPSIEHMINTTFR